MRYTTLILATLVTLFAAGCATVRDLRVLSQPENQTITASIGSSLFRLTKKGDLPNAFGGRDIYGGKVDLGFAEAKLVGIRDGGLVDLLVFDVSRASSETTMDRYVHRPAVDVSQSVNIGTTDYAAGIPVTIDTKSEQEYVLSGVKITFIEVRKSSVVFTVKDLQPNK
jgi:hypothetical protein